jgi:hypothetical protein
MKKTFIILFCGIANLCIGQAFSGRSNLIVVDYRQPGTTTSLPEIAWTAPQVESTMSTTDVVVLEAVIRSEMLIKDITLEVINAGNRYEKKAAFDSNSSLCLLKQNLKLLPGENRIVLIVENVNGGVVKSTRSVLVGKNEIALAVDANRKDYALIFATDKYDSWENLVNPIADAHVIESILKEKYGFKTELIENATLEEVTAKLYDYNTKKFNPQDQLFVFFAGHGYYDEVLGEGYVVTSNSLSYDKGKSSYLSHNLLRQRLENIKCDHVFLAMDVCFGGTFDPVLARARGGDALDEATDSQYLARKLTKRTRKYLTSGSKEYVSDGAQGKHSPFAARFIQALREVGGGTGRILTLYELNTYFQKLKSEPRSGSFGSDNPASDFVFVAQN